MTNNILYSATFCMLLFTSGNLLQAQSNSCCNAGASSTAEFARLGKELSFVIAHQEPIPYTLENPSGTTVTFSCPDGKNGQGYMIKAKKKSDKYIFVIHEWWGVNDYIKKESENLAAAFPDVNILALDIYDGKVASTREEASALMQAVSQDRGESIFKGASDFAGTEARIATIGWCFGGGWSLKGSLLLGDKAAACIIYYGMPVRKAEELIPLKAPVLGIFASEDGWITPAVVQEFKEVMIENGKDVEIYFYTAPHAFANPSNPGYNKDATKDAWEKSLSFIRKNL
jgi:carboxymethylenebutenolidase